MRRIVDLSIDHEAHFRWGVERSVRQETLPDGGVFTSTSISTTVHAFTHMDAPRHVVEDGPTTDDISLDRVVGETAVVDLLDIADGEAITEGRLAERADHVTPGDMVILKTAWDTRRDIATPAYWRDAPYMTREASEWLRTKDIRAIGFDFPQDYPIRLMLDGERRAMVEMVTHDVLLRNGVIMFEYLGNTAALREARSFVCALPMKLPGSDGAPARIIAIEGLLG